jgi:cyclomaltodextrinase
MTHWATESVFYHIYPLGLCGAPPTNDFHSPTVPRLDALHGWLDHLEGVGVNALYLGPVFESSRHGYDTVDYYHVDRRLGDNATLARLSEAIHRRGIRLILDAVFNHVGRDFWAFYNLRQRGEASPYRDWFYNLHFGEPNPYGDPFSYEGWEGHTSLVKLDVTHPAVEEHLLGAVAQWVADYDIDGLRLDAADCIDTGFLQKLAAYGRSLKPDFWLVGEIVHGDYTRWANPATLDSVTNYEAYKALYSSHNDHNYFEMAYALNRQFGADGLYRGLPLYAFADNHDVTRVASQLANPAHLRLLYTLLFTMPGVPSIYYGSEWGIPGEKTSTSDAALRPALDLAQMNGDGAVLAAFIAQLAHIRRGSSALQHGDYQQLHVAHEQLAFLRRTADQVALVAVNAADQSVTLSLPAPEGIPSQLTDALSGRTITAEQGQITLDLPPTSGTVLLS